MHLLHFHSECCKAMLLSYELCCYCIRYQEVIHEIITKIPNRIYRYISIYVDRKYRKEENVGRCFLWEEI